MSDDLKLQLILEAVNKTAGAFDQLKRDLNAATGGSAGLGNAGAAAGDKVAAGMVKANKQVGLLGGGISALAGRFLVLELGITHIGRLLNKLVFDFNSTLETSGLGIAAAFMAGGQYVDGVTGKTLVATDALAAARAESAAMLEQLQVANFATIATLDQLVRAYQETLPVAMAKGFDTRQVKDFTVAMVQAAGAIGLSLDMLGEETRSILTGAINPRTSRIATVLGLTNEEVARHMSSADELFSFLMQKLEAYKVAGVASQETWKGVWSNTLDIFNQISAKVSEPLFETVKAELMDIAESIVTIDQATGQIRWNEEFTEGVEGTKAAINAVIAEMYRMGMLIDKIGGTMTAIGAFATFGDWDAKMREWNAQLEARYNESDRKLQELANRSVGLNSDGTPKTTSGRSPGYRPNPLPEDPSIAADAAKKAEAAAKAAARLAAQWEKTKAAMTLEVEKLGLDKYQARIADLTAKAADLREQFGAKGDIDTWLEAMIAEVNSDKLTDTLSAAKGLAQEMAKELRVAAEQARAAAEAERAARESALNLRQAEIELAERTGQMDSGEALRERLALNQELLGLQTAHLAQLDKLADASAWYAQADAVNATRLNLVDLNDELLRQTGTFSEGWERALDDYVKNADTAFEQAEGLAKRAAEGMESAFSDFFFDAFRGKLTSLADYLDAFLQAVQRAMSDMLAQQAASGIASMVSGFFSPAAGGSTFQPSINTGAFSVRHDGGPVLPRFHTGGLLPDEVPIIAQTGERVLSRQQNGTFDRLARFLDRGGEGGGVNVQVVNNTGTEASGRAERSQSNNGDILRIVLDKVDSAIGEGRFDKSLGVVYGLRRNGVPR
jgi:hypothetical protein